MGRTEKRDGARRGGCRLPHAARWRGASGGRQADTQGSRQQGKNASVHKVGSSGGGVVEARCVCGRELWREEGWLGIERVVERGTLLHWIAAVTAALSAGAPAGACAAAQPRQCAAVARAERSAAARAGRLLGLAARLKLGHHSVELRAGAHSLQLLKRRAHGATEGGQQTGQQQWHARAAYQTSLRSDSASRCPQS